MRQNKTTQGERIVKDIADKMHADIEGSRLELFDNCGHWPQHERPELYNPLAIEFLKANSGT